MKKIIIFLFLSTSLYSFSQKIKKQTRYYNYENAEVSKTVFESLNDNFYFKKVIIDESQISHRAYYRKVSGQLTLAEKDSILSAIENSINVKFDKSKSIIIHHYKKTCKTIDKEIGNNKYLTMLKKYPSAKAYFVSEMGFKSTYKVLSEDGSDVISNYFISNNYDDTNYIIIKPDGKFYVIFGKYDLIRVLDIAV